MMTSILNLIQQLILLYSMFLIIQFLRFTVQNIKDLMGKIGDNPQAIYQLIMAKNAELNRKLNIMVCVGIVALFTGWVVQIL